MLFRVFDTYQNMVEQVNTLADHILDILKRSNSVSDMCERSELQRSIRFPPV